MPELPEVHAMVQVVATACKRRVFRHVSKSEVSRNPCIVAPASLFTVSAASRGKEMILTLTPAVNEEQQTGRRTRAKTALGDAVYVLLQPGMSGRVVWYPDAAQCERHAHLKFREAQGPGMLSFVDPRRFGRWASVAGPACWSPARGPDPVFEWAAFCAAVASSPAASSKRAIAEVMLDQRYFNGIGNYLRAEIIARAGIPPRTSAAAALSASLQLHRCQPDWQPTVDAKETDLLRLCYIVPSEVINLRLGDLNGDRQAFSDWLQVYGKGSSYRDGQGRTMWYRSLSSAPHVCSPDIKPEVGKSPRVKRQNNAPDTKARVAKRVRRVGSS